jgi:hypothetical protein
MNEGTVMARRCEKEGVMTGVSRCGPWKQALLAIGAYFAIGAY